MCDEYSESDIRKSAQAGNVPPADYQTFAGMNRRAFALAGIGAATLGLAPKSAIAQKNGTKDEAPSTAPGFSTKHRTVSITTPDGTADAFFVTPTYGQHPAVIIWPDIAGLREAYEIMATQLARAGYSVLAVNQYYRNAPAPILKRFTEWQSDEGRAKITPMRDAITPARTISDAGYFIDWLDQQPETDTKRKIGSSGYCMGGPFTIRTALARPDRVGAVASFHGSGMVNDTADSPHAQFAKIKAALLIAIAQNDDARTPTDKDVLAATARDSGRDARIEVYPAQHGWCTLDSPVFDEAQAAKAWQRMLTLFDQNL